MLVFVPLCTGICCWWIQRVGKLNSFFLCVTLHRLPHHPHSTSSTFRLSSSPTRISSITWLFVIISVIFPPNFIIFYLMLFILLRVQGFLCYIYFFFKTVPFLDYHHAREQFVFFGRFFFLPRCGLEGNLNSFLFIGPELRSVARGRT